MSEKEIQKILIENLNFVFLFPNCFAWGLFECDLIGLSKSGYLYEIEIKTTCADLLNDTKKQKKYWCKKEKKTKHTTKYNWLLNGEGPSKFYYAVTENIDISFIPPWAGVYVIKIKHGFSCVTKIREAVFLNKEKQHTDIYINLLQSMFYKHYFKK